MSDSDEYFTDDLVLNDHDRAVLDIEEQKWQQEQERMRQQERPQQRQQVPQTVEMTRQALRRPIEQDAPLPAAKLQKTMRRMGQDARSEKQMGERGMSVATSARMPTAYSPPQPPKPAPAHFKQPSPSAALQGTPRHLMESQIQAILDEAARQNTRPSSGVSASQRSTTSPSTTVHQPGSVANPSCQASALCAPPQQTSVPQSPLPDNDSHEGRDLGAEIDVLRAELAEVRRVVNELRRSS